MRSIGPSRPFCPSFRLLPLLLLRLLLSFTHMPVISPFTSHELSPSIHLIDPFLPSTVSTSFNLSSLLDYLILASSLTTYQPYHLSHRLWPTTTCPALIASASSLKGHHRLTNLHAIPMDSRFSDAGPVLMPAAPHHPFHAFPGASSFIQGPHSQWAAPMDAPSPAAPVQQSFARATRPSLSSNPSRKRSRDVYAEDGDALATLRAASSASSFGVELAPAPFPPLESSSMLLDGGLPMPDPSSCALSGSLDRPLKSARRSIAPTPTTLPSLATPSPSALSLASTGPSTPSPTTMDEPSVAPAALVLGVGWTEPTESDVDAPAVRGWTRFLANHFPALGPEPRIVLRHAGGDGGRFVVHGQGAWWLFGEDLGEGKLLGHDWDAVVGGLRLGAVAGGGETIAAASTTPAAVYAGNILDIPATDAAMEATSAADGATLAASSPVHVAMDLDG